MKIPKEIISEINNRLNKHHKMYSLPVSGLFWEEVLYRALKRCGYNAEWEPGSHKTEEDIESKEIGSISCKGGLIRVGCNTIIISGSRTTSLKTFEEKLAYISTRKCDYIFSLSSKLNKACNKRHYTLLVFDRKKIKYDSLNWFKEGNNYVGHSKNITARINHSMSCQLWTTLDLKLANERHDFEISII